LSAPTPPPLRIVDASIRELMKALDEAKRKRLDEDLILKLVDQVDLNIDQLLCALAPEKITDERFEAAVNAINDVSAKLKDLREMILDGRLAEAKKKALEVQSSVRTMYRVLTIIRAGAPTPIILQFAPEYVKELQAPETLLYSSPLAARAYNILSRRMEVSIDELARELNVDERTRDEFNRAITLLITNGYARPYFTPDNRMVLRWAR